jgi:uncharacterized membrane protein
MTLYLSVKLIHIVSSTILLGTGLGIAFFMFSAHRSQNLDAFRVTVRYVVQADWIFTAPAVIVQLISGLWLTVRLGISMASAWFMVVISLFVLVGACWLPVVRIQIQLRKALESHDTAQIELLMRKWTVLGFPAFAAVLLLMALMVFKPGIATILSF